MNRQIFEQRLTSLNSREESKITALVEEYRAGLAAVQNTALSYVESKGIHTLRARSVVAQLGETVLASMMQVMKAQKPVPDTSLLLLLVEGVMRAEFAVTEHLKVALKDGRLVPQPPGLSALEEVGPPYRVCDEGYTMLRRILNLELLEQYLMESRHFLALPDSDKNTEIESWLQIGCFTCFLDDIDLEEQ